MHSKSGAAQLVDIRAGVRGLGLGCSYTSGVGLGFKVSSRASPGWVWWGGLGLRFNTPPPPPPVVRAWFVCVYYIFIYLEATHFILDIYIYIYIYISSIHMNECIYTI